MSTTDTTAPVATVTPIKAEPVRATWAQHGKPTGKFQFFGTAVKEPAAKGIKVKLVHSDAKVVELVGFAGPIEGGKFGPATKFWAVVPEDAPRVTVEPKPEKAQAGKLAPVVITAAKGGDTTVAPKTGAIAKAIAKSGRSIMAISREHGLNPSQLRRLSLDQVAKVDTVRAELIATALGVKLADLFDAPETKAKAIPKATPAPATTAPAE
jgi:hypothetical protein